MAKKGRFKAGFVRLGEGSSEDYNPKDKNDKELLRIDLFVDRDGDRQWEPMDDGSYCTCIPVNTAKKEKQRLLKMAVKVMARARKNGISLKRQAEHLSWLEPGITQDKIELPIPNMKK